MMLIASGHHVPIGVTIVFALLLLGLILSLAFEEKLHAKKSVIAGTFAIICLFLGSLWGVLPFEAVVVGSHALTKHDGLTGEYIDCHDQFHELKVEPLVSGAHAHGTGESGGQPAAKDGGHSSAGDSQDVASNHDNDEHAEDEPTEGPRSVHVDGHRVLMPVYIPAVDWGVIAIILGSSLFVDITSKSGLFTWIALKVTKASGGDPRKLLFFYGIMTVVFSAVLNNVTAMIIIGSLTAVSLNKLGREDKLLAFLLIEGLLTNIGGLLTLISSVPNIIVGTAANISFVEFVYKAAPYVVFATLITLGMSTWMFKIKSLKTEEEKAKARELVATFDETDGIESWGFFWFGAAMLLLFIFTIATTSVLPVISDLEMGFVAISFAALMLLRYKSEADEFYRALDWDLIGFFMALFVVINVMEHALVLDYIGMGLAAVIEHGGEFSSGAILIASAVFSSVTDNIPLAAMLSKILTGLGTPINTVDASASPLWWAVIFGANLGGNITPIGSASTLVAVTIIHRHKLHLTFAGFVKIALPFAIVQIVLATIYVMVFC